MKRIANYAAVATLLYTIPGNQVVKIVDVDHNKYTSVEPWENADVSFGLTYTVNEILYNSDHVKIARARIRRTAINEGMLLLVIDTKAEEY